MASTQISSVNGIEIREVETGTVIEHHGCKMTVSDKHAVQVANIIYCTPAQFKAISQAASQKK